MQIPLNPSSSPNKPPLELKKINLYSTGYKGKVFTNHFYKSMNHNFGIEIEIRNNTSKMQNIRIGGCIYDHNGNTTSRWNTTINVSPHTTYKYDCYVKDEAFTRMKEGKYKVQFWINDKKVQKEYFYVTYK